MTTTFTDAELHRPLNRSDYKTMALSALGGALEFYDFVIYVYFANVIGQLFFPHNMPDWLIQLQTYGIFAAGYLARPLGGIIIAHFGDKLGRKRMFTLSIFLMAVPTLAIGLLPTYATIGVAAPLLLLLLRILQGAAIGGEVPGAWVFVSEHAPARKTGLAVGTLTAGLTFGILLGSLIKLYLNTHYTPAEIAAQAWRYPFLLGGIFGFFAVYLRRFLDETPIFKELHARKALADGLPLKPILERHLPAVGVSMLLTWVLSAAIVVVILMTPNYIQKVFHVTDAMASEANALATLALTIGCVVFGWATDRFGARITMLVGFTGLLLTSWLFYGSLPAADDVLLRNYTLAGFFVGAIATVPYVAVRAFPATVRFTGLSFSYNVAYAIFGGMTPVVLAAWINKNPQAPAIYVAALAVLGFLLAFSPQVTSTLPSAEADRKLASKAA
ncbi:Predicted arabinose efflux permease, MFS family [Andreprevotia lacus DSM 23236]|jgi:MFS family permease|uniref:Predicted arabinose efflux permease, MFS family n=1 Tax=Andreprevotia lacus DSM 23236 TaxID=1121001 RepID=A0A1W1X9A3_9NEIS|nr:MFS transporter [Andreprevotia lacus]SMC20486.1 Predicted arabinose efflux permease, MFS family [Andreprevotia lacus DSM 23236]